MNKDKSQPQPQSQPQLPDTQSLIASAIYDDMRRSSVNLTDNDGNPCPIPDIRCKDVARGLSTYVCKMVRRYVVGHVKYAGSDLALVDLDNHLDEELMDAHFYRMARHYRPAQPIN